VVIYPVARTKTPIYWYNKAALFSRAAFPIMRLLSFSTCPENWKLEELLLFDANNGKIHDLFTTYSLDIYTCLLKYTWVVNTTSSVINDLVVLLLGRFFQQLGCLNRTMTSN
jgi:hypothetical protein